ncbi:MAG: formylglycine-generating enzyme family protein [Candidatus Poribacteria bacterium]|jgi:formylglycine-generating enzyme required for sulfatase activity|nr:formylglycine-generating enzyme family protein [Candidatus Poribacteria bacterium]MDP6746284.1 formylglycine-generating enzyme family protein [Candidatus Poribacteria bacterium]MDP6998159.1 formylglycine-generating enzyme family protein [Candidatus Poribacteria bacterium]
MRKAAYLSVLLPLLTISLWAQEQEQENRVPLVTNVKAEQVDFEHVLIRYDVEDLDGDTMTVSVKVSANNKRSFGVPVTELEGAVGEGITSGTGKEIVWTIIQDVALHQYGEGYVVAVMADDRAEPEQRITWEKDGAEMALIPAGSFEMGDHLDGMSNALPVHTVELDRFYMDVNEVTVGQFKQFVKESGYNYNRWANPFPDGSTVLGSVVKYSPTDDHPMIYIDWNDAVAYTKWAGKRLPTEAEWEYAARGGLSGKRYSWGDDVDVAQNYGNFHGVNGPDTWGEYPQGSTAPVGSFEPNGYGLYDMAGNVWEWCADWYAEDYYSKSLAKNPLGPVNGTLVSGRSRRIMRGGAWAAKLKPAPISTRSFNEPTRFIYFVGFRCVSGLE